MPKTLNLFVSLPMRGKTIADIRARQQEVFEAVVSNSQAYEWRLLDTVHEGMDCPPENLTFYLGESIKKLGEADLVIFDKNWRNANGCRIEHVACELYNIPHMYVDSEEQNDTDE